MYKVKLVNPPFASLQRPSIALTQLRSVVRQRFGDDVSVDICYVNHDVGRHIGPPLYAFLANATEANTTGLGDWLFRQVAFPETPDNADVYFRRYYPHSAGRSKVIRATLLAKRQGLERLLDSVIDEYGLAEADLVGFTSMFSQNVPSFALARMIKQRAPDTVVVMGGANCEPPMGEEIVARVAHMDFVFCGPALRSFPLFIEHVRNGDPGAAGALPGVHGRSKARRMLLQPHDTVGEELDINETPPLDYQDFLASVDRKLAGEVEPSLLFETSRGCWWGEKAHCTFCGMNGLTMNYRQMKPDLAVQMFNELFHQRESIRYYECVDNILPRNYVRDVLGRLEPPADATLFYEVKSDLTRDDLGVLARAHVRLIQPGIESLATSTLKLMKKGSSAFQNLALLKHCIETDVGPLWNLLVGFPGEGEEVYRKYVEIIPRLTHLPPPSGVFPVRFDRFSPYFTQANAYGLDLHPHDFYSLIYPFPDEALRKMAYYFTDRTAMPAYLVALSGWLRPLQRVVEAWRARWSGGAAHDFPKLYLAAGENVVVDTRGAREVREEVLPLERAVLTALGEAATPARLAAPLGVAASAIDATLTRLLERGLLFEENGRFISLVHDTEPALAAAITESMKPPQWLLWLERQAAEREHGAAVPA